MCRSVTICVTVLLAIVTALLAFRYWQAPDHAQDVAVDAAQSLGLNLLAFESPSRSGSNLFGTEAIHWERRYGATPVERVSYFREDERLCWSVRENHGWKDNGCISTRPYER
jgi:hypothetical protein